MTAYKETSHYFSEDQKKRATVIQELGTNRYVVRMISDSGSAYSASFENIEDAEKCAEGWVI